jgi:hypothetical protein
MDIGHELRLSAQLGNLFPDQSLMTSQEGSGRFTSRFSEPVNGLRYGHWRARLLVH